MKKQRARDLGIPLEGTTGKFNAITDVPGVTVGYSTIIEGKDARTGAVRIMLPLSLLGCILSMAMVR